MIVRAQGSACERAPERKQFLDDLSKQAELKIEGAVRNCLFTSALTFVEAARAVSRAKRERKLDAGEAREAERQLAAFERSCDVIALGDEVLRRSREDFPEEPVRSLDAIHLACVRVLDAELGGFDVASCDDRVRRNAAALGFGLVPRRERSAP